MVGLFCQLVDFGVANPAQFGASFCACVLTPAIPIQVQSRRKASGNPQFGASVGDDALSLHHSSSSGIVSLFPGDIVIEAVDRADLLLEIRLALRSNGC